MGRWRYVTRGVAAGVPVFIGVFLAGLLLSVIEPFGLGAATRAHSERITARVLAPFYRSEAQDQIAVILIDDVTLEHEGLAWPPRYSDYEVLLRRVLAHQPRAIYVDILMEQRRDYDASFEDADEALHETVAVATRSERLGGDAIPVFFGVSAPGRASIFSKPGVIEDVVTSWQGAGDQYPLMIAGDQINEAAVSAGTGGAGHRSVALALYDAACPDTGAPGCAQPASVLSSPARADAMAVQWGWQRPVLAEARGIECVRSSAASAPERWAEAMRLALQSLVSGVYRDAEERGRSRCPYTLTLFAEQLADGALLRGGTVPAVLEDRVVLVGTHILGLDDRVPSPVHQTIPGVYLHAMALDNLMTWGEDRVRSVRGAGVVIDVLLALLLSLVVGLLRAHDGMARRWRLLGLLALPLLAVAVVMLAQWLWRQPPQDWIGMTLLVLMAGGYVLGRGNQTRNGEGSS